jgi:hypothetical protein
LSGASVLPITVAAGLRAGYQPAFVELPPRSASGSLHTSESCCRLFHRLKFDLWGYVYLPKPPAAEVKQQPIKTRLNRYLVLLIKS